MSLWPSRKWDTWRTKAWRRKRFHPAATQTYKWKKWQKKQQEESTKKISRIQKVFKPVSLWSGGKICRKLPGCTAKVLKDLFGHGCHQGQINLGEDLPKLLGVFNREKKSWCHPPQALFYHDFTLENHDLEPDAGWWNRNCKGGSNRNIRTCSSFVPGRKLGLTNHPLQALPTMNCNNGWFRVSSLIHPWKWDDDPQLAFIFHSPA